MDPANCASTPETFMPYFSNCSWFDSDFVPTTTTTTTTGGAPATPSVDATQSTSPTGAILGGVIAVVVVAVAVAVMYVVDHRRPFLPSALRFWVKPRAGGALGTAGSPHAATYAYSMEEGDISRDLNSVTGDDSDIESPQKYADDGSDGDTDYSELVEL